MNKKEFSQLIKNARENRKSAQKDLANLMFNSPQTISLWEKGKLDIKLDLLCKLTNTLSYSFLDFLNGQLIDSNEPFNFDNQEFLNNIKRYCKENKITKNDFQQHIDVSKPTLNKIIKGEVIISLWQYLEFCSKFNLELNKFFIEEETVENIEIEEKHEKRHVPCLKVCSAFAFLAILISIVVPVSLMMNKNRKVNDVPSNQIGINSTIDDVSENNTHPSSVPSTNELVKEEKPNIIIDKSLKRLTGFDINKAYLINNDEYKIENESIEIDKSWYLKYIEIKCKTEGKSEYSDPLNLYINPFEFDNFFDESILGNTLPNINDYNENETKINLLSSSNNNESKTYTLNNEEKIVLKDSLGLSLPYFHDDIFDQYLNLKTFSSSIAQLDYEILNENEKDYVLIKGLKDSYKNIIEEIYIPKQIENITDIRIANEAFKLIENVQYENLNTIIFEEKPHYLGDEVFSGLSLRVLDFGYVDDLSYSVNYNFQTKSIQEEGYTYTVSCSKAFKGLKHVDKIRLPLKICEEENSRFYNSLFDTENKKLSEYDDNDFRGFNAFVLPRVKDGTYSYKAKKIANMKIYSLYIPKGIEFYPEFGKDLYLRLVKFEKDYSFIKSENEYLGNTYYNFGGCYALQFYIRNIEKTFEIPKYFLKGNISFKGMINYENIISIADEAFRGANLPKNIQLKNITSIGKKAFYMPFNLERVDIYKSDSITSESPLIINKNCFVNQENSNYKIKKIVFHNFEENEIKKDTSYKSEDILEEFVND